LIVQPRRLMSGCGGCDHSAGFYTVTPSVRLPRSSAPCHYSVWTTINDHIS